MTADEYARHQRKVHMDMHLPEALAELGID